MNIQHVLGSGELNSALWLLIFFSFIVIIFFGGGGADLIHKGIPFPSHSFHFQEIVYDFDAFLDLLQDFFNNRIFVRADVGLCDL